MENYDCLKLKIENIIRRTKGKVCLCFYDLKENKGFGINELQKMRSASTIKLLIMAELMRRVKNKEFSLSDKIAVTKDNFTGGDGILKELEYHHEFSLKELVTLMIIVSDNEATNILIDLLGMENINKLGKNLKLKEADLQRKMMDSEALAKGYDNYICAEDLKTILQKIYEGKLINKKSSEIMLDILKRQTQGERLQRYIAEELTIAHKSGDLDNLEHECAIIFLEDMDYIIVVMTDDMNSNLEGREIIGKISKTIYDELGGKKLENGKTLYITGESKTNMNNAITKMYGSFFLAFEVEIDSGIIVRADSNTTLDLTKSFISRLFIGKNMKDDEFITEEITNRYYGSSAKAIIAAYHDALKHYENL
ncbi:beta-lactamase [Peptoniphilus sp. ING2-D1G]|nr:beta-lactamase [Peptoniphilus sp. ING2-D1G]